MGIAILPQSVVADDLASGRLVGLSISDWPDAYRTIRVLLRAEGPTPQPVQALLRLLQERYGHA
jgi:DNA-binding transcriptional LysR family regulator